MTNRFYSRAHGSKEDWLTDPKLIKAFGEFDLDPCCPPNMPWRTAKIMLTLKENGLKTPWGGRVWLNPPYGFKITQWMKLMAAYGNGIALVPPRVETKWCHSYVWQVADAVLFPKKRVQFYQWSPDGVVKLCANNTTPSMVVAYGTQNADALMKASEEMGWYVDNTFSKITQLPS
jgi:hypothetical protein